MTDLTEQLYTGTLPTGHYYFNNGVETYIVLYSNINTKDRKMQEPSGLTVISEVPSYEEWEKLNNACHELEKETACLTVDNVNLKKWRKLAYDAKPIIIAHQNNAKTLAQKLLQVKPELREWLEVNFKEYL